MTTKKTTQGRFVWHELCTRDVKGAVLFYTELFGWKPFELEAPGYGKYTMLKRDGKDVGGIASLSPGEKAPHWRSFCWADAIQGTVEHVDLIMVRRGEKVTVDVAVRVTGEVFPGGLLDQQLVQVPVEAEATNIPQSFEVDVTGMEIGTAVHAADLKAHLLAQVRIQVRERFVQEQRFRLDHDRPRERDALLLPAREFRRIAVGEGGHAHAAQHLAYAVLDLGTRAALHAQACLLHPSHAADDPLRVDLVGRRIVINNTT